MKTKATAIISIMIACLIIGFVTAYVSTNDNVQTIRYTNAVTVSGGEISCEAEPDRFDPVGETCEFDIEISSMDDILTEVRITTESLDNDPIFDSSVSNGKLSTGELKVDNKKIYIELIPALKSGAELEDGEYYVGATIILRATEVNVLKNVGIILSALVSIALAVFAIISVNKDSQKQYDERQIRARGASAVNAMIVMMVTALGFAMISHSVETFPLSIFTCCIIIAMAGAVTFLITADMNDAFFGFQNNRKMLSIVYLFAGLAALFSFIMNMVVLQKGLWTELKVTTLIIAVSMLTMGIEMIVHGIIEKKEALADEES